MSVETAAGRPYPAAFHLGAGHLIVHGNAAFLRVFGQGCVGQPAREALLDLPPAAFELMDLVYRTGKPLASRIDTPAGERRLVVAARIDPETGETYGVTTHLRPIASGPPPGERDRLPR
jgi:hypothetical protein